MTGTDDVLDMLADDMVSHGWLAWYLKLNADDADPTDEQIKSTLVEVLESGNVEVGVARAIPNCVEFVAWRGTIDERLNRALATVKAVDDHDKLFAYWLCLNENVDRFEE